MVCREDGSGLQPLDDVFQYSITDDAWQSPELSGEGPAARNAAVACFVGDNRILVHGGWDPFKHTYDDSYLLQH